MELRTVTYRTSEGWAVPLPTAMDSDRTLVLAFAAPEFAADPTPFEQLAAAFPTSLLVGCSTSGEIAGSQVHDASISVALAHFEHTLLRRAFTEVSSAADSFTKRASRRASDPARRASEPPSASSCRS